MFNNTVNLARRLGLNLKNNRVAQGVGLLAVSGASFAQTGGGSFTVDTTEMLAAIAAGLAAALIVSISMSSAKISVRASKLPRAGA